jgi:hypothetical protein
MTPSEILLKAADLLAERGWTQGVLEDYEGRMCAAGAVYNVTCNSSAALELLQAHIGFSDNIAAWNDAPGRTAEDVILAMKRAAK